MQGKIQIEYGAAPDGLRSAQPPLGAEKIEGAQLIVAPEDAQADFGGASGKTGNSAKLGTRSGKLMTVLC